MIITLNYCLYVNPENRTSRELVFRAPDPKHLSENSQKFPTTFMLNVSSGSASKVVEKNQMARLLQLGRETEVFNLIRSSKVGCSKNSQLFTAYGEVSLIQLFSQDQLYIC